MHQNGPNAQVVITFAQGPDTLKNLPFTKVLVTGEYRAGFLTQ